METYKTITKEAEAELKVMTQNVYRNEGYFGVMQCIMEMQETQIIILKKLNEILTEENKKRGPHDGN